jgi:hypothetical protein
MKKATISLALIALGVVWLGRGAPQASADKAFRDQFVAAYVKADSDDAKDKTFSEAVEKAKCNICHEGKVKKNRNDYGKALGELLSRKTDTENKEKILAALKTVEAKHVNPKDDKSPTFGERIRAGKLPVEPKSGNQVAGR